MLLPTLCPTCGAHYYYPTQPWRYPCCLYCTLFLHALSPLDSLCQPFTRTPPWWTYRHIVLTQPLPFTTYFGFGFPAHWGTWRVRCFQSYAALPNAWSVSFQVPNPDFDLRATPDPANDSAWLDFLWMRTVERALHGTVRYLRLYLASPERWLPK